MATVKEFMQIKDDYTEAKKAVDQADGAINELMKQLKEDFDCDSLQEAEQLSIQIKKLGKLKGRKFDRALKQFRKDYPQMDIEEGE